MDKVNFISEFADLDLSEDIGDDELYLTYDITTYPSDLSIQVIFDQYTNDDRDIEIPRFQRGFVWTIKQSSLLIESILLGLPVPPVFFYVTRDNRSIVIDGQQRLRSVIYFLEGYFGEEDSGGKRRKFRLEGLNKNAPFLKKTFAELEVSDQRKIKNAVIRAINIRQLSPDDDGSSMFHIFERLNTGGTPLSPQEIRVCVYQGNIVDYLERLNRDPNWRTLLGAKGLDKRGRDQELILRLLGLTLRFEKYERPMKEFLNQTMAAFRNVDRAAVQRFEVKFYAVTKAISELLGPRPFRLTGATNTAILDAVMVAALASSKEVPPDLEERFRTLLADDEFLQAATRSTADTAFVSKRIKKAQGIIFNAT